MLVNLILPGSGLVLRDRVALGLVLVLPAVALLALGLATPVVATPDFARHLALGLTGAYLVLALVAGALWWWLERSPPVDREAVLRRHRAAATAWLRGDAARARQEAEALCRQAPALPGAWILLAMIARRAGDGAAADRAEARGRRLQRRQQEAELAGSGD